MQRVQSVTHHQPHAGARGVQPVDRWLTILEVVQIHPATVHPVYTSDDRGGAPVRVFDTRLMEDNPLHLADDVTGLRESILGLQIEVDRVLSLWNRRQEMPVLGRDLHHVVDARIVTNLHLRQTKVGTLARVARHDVIDDGASVRGRHLTH